MCALPRFLFTLLGSPSQSMPIHHFTSDPWSSRLRNIYLSWQLTFSASSTDWNKHIQFAYGWKASNSNTYTTTHSVTITYHWSVHQTNNPWHESLLCPSTCSTCSHAPPGFHGNHTLPLLLPGVISCLVLVMLSCTGYKKATCLMPKTHVCARTHTHRKLCCF